MNQKESNPKNYLEKLFQYDSSMIDVFYVDINISKYTTVENIIDMAVQ